MIACLSLYTLTLLSNFISIDRSVEVGMQEDSCSKKSEALEGKIATYSVNSALARKQLL